jgi:hypothetical protein
MIHWWSVGTNTLWIVGMALLLATFSYRRCCVAQFSGGKQRITGWSKPDLAYLTGWLGVSAGFCLTGETWLIRSIWGGVTCTVLLKIGIKMMSLYHRVHDDNIYHS